MTKPRHPAQDCEATEGVGFGAVKGSASCDICQATFFFRTETQDCEPCVGKYGEY